MTEDIKQLPFDLNCPASTRCGGFLRTFGIDNGSEKPPTIKFFICSNKDSSETPCPANPMISKYGNSRCKACGDTIEMVLVRNSYFHNNNISNSVNFRGKRSAKTKKVHMFMQVVKAKYWILLTQVPEMQ